MFLPTEFTALPNGSIILFFAVSKMEPNIPPLRFLRFSVILFPLPSVDSTVSSTSSPNKSLLNASAFEPPVIAPSNVKMGPPGSRDSPGIRPIPMFQIVLPAIAPAIDAGAYFFTVSVTFFLNSLEISPDFSSIPSPKIIFLS